MYIINDDLKRKRSTKQLLILVLILLLSNAFVLSAAHAGKAGVFLSAKVYFTLEEAVYSEGQQESSLRFKLTLHNNSNQSIDFNRYGVRAAGASGQSYAAKLISKQAARVEPGTEQTFHYIAAIKGSPAAAQLKVVIFAWDQAEEDFMRDLGSLPVLPSLASSSSSGPEAAIQLSKADASLTADSLLLIQPNGTYVVLQDGAVQLYIHLIAENMSSSSMTLPESLRYRVFSEGGQSYDASAVDGAAKALLPGETRQLTLLAELPSAEADTRKLKLELYTGGNQATAEITLGGLDVSPAAAFPSWEENEAVLPGDAGEPSSITASITAASAALTADGILYRAEATLTNNGLRTASVPDISAVFQDGTEGAATADLMIKPTSLATGESVKYYLQALLPANAAPEHAELVLFAKKAQSAASLPVMQVSLHNVTAAQPGSESIYIYGSSIPLAPGGIVDSDLVVTMEDFRLYENEEAGYPTAVAKFKLTNVSDSPKSVPAWATELVSGSGEVFSGEAGALPAATIAPHTSVLLITSYLMPKETAGPLTMHIYDAQTLASKKLTLASYMLEFRVEEELETAGSLNLYPFEFEIRNAVKYFTAGTSTFSYNINLSNTTKRQDTLLAPSDVIKLEFRLTDDTGTEIAAASYPLIGTGRLLDGQNKVSISNIKIDWMYNPHQIHLYEVVETPAGTVKRHLMQL